MFNLVFTGDGYRELLMLKENGTINVCVACDDNYAKYAGVVIASILNNADSNDKLAIFILDGGISEEHKREITL